MATRLVGVDSEDPILPDSVITASRSTIIQGGGPLRVADTSDNQTVIRPIEQPTMFGRWDIRWHETVDTSSVGQAEVDPDTGQPTTAPVYLANVFANEAAFQAAFPAAHDVWDNWLCRITRTKPGTDVVLYAEPNTGDASSWENLTLDWACIQEALETERHVYIPHGNYILSDTLLRRLSESKVECRGNFYCTRGMSRGNVLAIGEGEEIEWLGGSIDGTNTLGDNCLTVFQNQVTSAVEGWESVNAKRIIVGNMNMKNITRDFVVGPYNGGKGFSLQFGCREVIVFNVHTENCEIGWTVEGKTSSTPVSGDDPLEPYYARAISLTNVVVKDAALMGCHIINSSNTDDPNAGSVIGTALTFIDCALDEDQLGVICGDRAANIHLDAQVITTDDSYACTPVRGIWLYGTHLKVSANSGVYRNVVDTRHPHGQGSNALGCVGAVFEVFARARVSSSVNPIYRSPASGGEAPAPVNCAFKLVLDGFTARQIGSTTLATSNWIDIVDLTNAVHYENWGSATDMDATDSAYRRIKQLGMVSQTSDPSLSGAGTIHMANAVNWNPLNGDTTVPYLVLGLGSSSYGSLVPRPRSNNATNIGNIAHGMNTGHKYLGQMIWNTTTSQPMWSTGATAGSAWVALDGTTITPA